MKKNRGLLAEKNKQIILKKSNYERTYMTHRFVCFSRIIHCEMVTNDGDVIMTSVEREIKKKILFFFFGQKNQ